MKKIYIYIQREKNFFFQNKRFKVEINTNRKFEPRFLNSSSFCACYIINAVYTIISCKTFEHSPYDKISDLPLAFYCGLHCEKNSQPVMSCALEGFEVNMFLRIKAKICQCIYGLVN